MLFHGNKRGCMKKSVSKDSLETVKIKHRDSNASKEKLLSAAKEVFSKYGFKGATTKMIAKKADMNESLIGRYFNGKYGLLISLIEKLILEVRSIDLPYPAQETLDLELQAYCAFRIEHLMANEGFFKIIISQSLTDPKFLKQARAKIPMDADSPQLEARIKALHLAKKIHSAADLIQLVEDIEIHCMGVFFFQLVLKCEDKGQIMKQLNNFIKTFSIAYETSPNPSV